ncbi:MAG TPA: AraC family transcriptional regulator [Terriglobia bacterium]|nr:AraC family transcriptional regulator [Terriglobia bacterium]
MDKRVEAAKAIIEREYQRDLRIPELARRVGLGRSHRAFLFKVETGFTMKGCLREARLTQAAELLRGQHYDHVGVKQAAFAVGYRSIPNFTRDFTKRFGKNPSRPRRTANMPLNSPPSA